MLRCPFEWVADTLWMMMIPEEKSKPAENAQGELALMHQFAAGDNSAGEEILRRIQPRVEKAACFLSVNPFEREEIVQNALIRILNSAGQFRGESSLAWWADRITVFTAAKSFEKRDRRSRLTEQFWGPGVEVRAIDDEVDLERMKHALQKQLSTLPDDQRMVLVLHYLHGYQVNEIASLTGVKLNTARGRLRMALKKIRRLVHSDPVLKDWLNEAGQL